MTGPDRRDLGRVFNEAPELYDRVRPTYPDELFADLAAITGMDRGSSVLEVGCGTGQATRSLACGGTRLFSGSMGTASRISSARRRCTGGSTATSVNPSSTRSPSAFAPRWATGHHAAT